MFAVTSVVAFLDESMGFVLMAPGQKTVYFAGNTRWHECVELALSKYKPDYIVLNTGEAIYDGFDESLIMGTKCKKML